MLADLIDYAGLFPPAGLPLREVVENYDSYRESDYGWMLHRLVLPVARLAETPLGDDWTVTVLVEGEPGPLPPQVETLETRQTQRLSLPTYCEAPLDQLTSAFAKIRTGGVTADTIPSPETVADFLFRAAARRVPFKATAGLHHPARSLRPLTYAPDSPRAIMHGFLNLFTAAAFAWFGHERELLLAVLMEEDAAAFEFGSDELQWNGRKLATVQIQAARDEFAHSFGSCSFEDPVEDLCGLGLLP